MYVSLSNTNAILAYRLGTDGLLPAQPFDSMAIDNPREIVLNEGVLYVALQDRAAAIQLGPDGSLPSKVTSHTNPVNDSEAVDLLVRGDVLYVAFEGSRVVSAFLLDNGQLPTFPLSSGGTDSSAYRTITTQGDFLYAGSASDAELNTFFIQPDGSLPSEPEAQDPVPVVSFPDDMLVANGFLYVTSLGRGRIEAFELQANGLPMDEYDTSTDGIQRYARLLLDGNRLYASGFGEGRIDFFVLEADGSLPRTPAAETVADAATAPISLALLNGILYVVQSGPGRVDAYVVGADGAPPPYPSSSTDNIVDSAPLGLAIGTFPQ